MKNVSNLHAAIKRAQLGAFIKWVPMDPAPILTPEYDDVLKRYKAQIELELATVDSLLKSQTLDDLLDRYDADGNHNDDELKQVWDPYRARLAFFRDLNPIFLAGLGNPHYAADYKYWSRMEGLTIEETLWLCVGFDPRADWGKALRLDQSSRIREHREHRERTYILSIQEQLKRAAKSISDSNISFSGPELLEWMRVTEFPAHPHFLNCLEKIARRRSGALPAAPLEASSSNDPREIASLARILTAIAIREYGYQPHSKKSPIPKEIQAICDEEGLSTSRETILKYLRLGARQRYDRG